MIAVATSRPTVLLRVDAALQSARRSGIHRVIVELARALPQHAVTHLVRWDEIEGHLRPIDRVEFDCLFGAGRWPKFTTPNPAARRTAYRFDDLIDCSGDTWLLNPDVPMHSELELEYFARAITQSREYGARIASLFYDLIPATNALYLDDKPAYTAYLASAIRSDVLLPISLYSAKTLTDYLAEYTGGTSSALISPVRLAERQTAFISSHATPPGDTRSIVLIGTIEPRKRQVEFLRAFAKARLSSPTLARMQVHIAGSLHPDVADAFNALVTKIPGVHYHQYLSDPECQALLARAVFSVFASDDEGFGLPIVESLSVETPCLCANFGAMAETAAGGGCHTVDVRSVAALQGALIELAEQPQRLAELRQEIAIRTLRTWDDYARDLVAALKAARRATGAGADVIDLATRHPDRASDIADLADADVVLCPGKSTMDQFVEAAEAAGSPLLPSRWAYNAEAATEAARTLQAYRGRLQDIAVVERRYRLFMRQQRARTAVTPTFLRIVVTTYNRREFALENVRWLMLMLRHLPEIALVVVDNASTDGTAEALRATFGPTLRLVVNPTNVGMLGNIRVCSQIPGAEYVWVIGDDDFIVPGQLRPLVEALRGNDGAPLALINFGLYHREALGPSDHAAALISGQVPVALDPAPTGLMPLTAAAAQHDNLFTAIYSLVWRQDVLAAAYDHPFASKPFDSLIESIPCTDLLLRSFADCEVLWFEPVGIVGNAHNSWTRFRPRWHGRLMAEAISLARDAGVDRRRLAAWAGAQADLFEEAMVIAREKGWKASMNAPGDYALSWPLFRRRLTGSQT